MKLLAVAFVILANLFPVLEALSAFSLRHPLEELNVGSSKNLTARVYPAFIPGKWTSWPRREGGLQTINYCFEDQNARTRVKPILDAAMNIWITALGGPASAQTGHSLEFREHTANGQPIFCYLDPRHVVWNQMIPTDSLVTHWYDGSTAMATTAYRIHTDVTIPGRNSMSLGDVYSPLLPNQYAHEMRLGHVLGLFHEHQRPDRDDHIHYNPRNVDGYKNAAQAAMAATGMTEEEVVERFQNDAAFTKVYWPLGHAFVKMHMQDGNHWMHSGYDIKSIMHYEGSMGAADAHRARIDANACPMVDKHGQPVTYNPYPSWVDIAFVREFYPWHVADERGQMA